MAQVGRPRSTKAHAAILDAALGIARADGHLRVTMQRIAREAGVSKQTVYRWWASPAEVLLEALRERAKTRFSVPETGSLQADLAGFLAATMAGIRGVAGVLRALMAEAQHDPALAATLRRVLISPRRAALRSIFERARARGEIADLSAAELWLDIAFGVIWARLLTGVGPRNPALAARLATILAREAKLGGGGGPRSRGRRPLRAPQGRRRRAAASRARSSPGSRPGAAAPPGRRAGA
jgi:AcrR family transcriptional regulator